AAYLIAATSSQNLATVDYLLYAGLGLISAVVGIALMRLVSLVEAGVRRSVLPEWSRPAIGGLILIPIAMISPNARSAGHGAMHLSIGGEVARGALALVFALK